MKYLWRVLTFLVFAFNYSLVRSENLPAERLSPGAGDEGFSPEHFSFSYELIREQIAASQDAERLASGYFILGKGLLREKRSIDAAWAFHRAGSLSFPSSFRERAILESGLSWLEAGEFEKAVSEFNFLEKLSPGSPLAGEAFFRAGERALELGRIDEAQAFYEKASRNASRETGSYCLYGIAACKTARGKLEEARGILADLAGSSLPEPLREATIFELGVLNFYLGENEESRKWFERSLSQSEGKGEGKRAHLFLGELASRRNAHGEASYHFKKFLDGESDRALKNWALYSLGWSAISSGGADEAISYLQELRGENLPDEIRNAFLYALSICLTKLERYADAIASLKELLSDKAKGTWSELGYFALAYNYLAVGDPRSSIQTINTFLKNFPESRIKSQAEFLKGEILYREKRYSEAIEAYKKRLDSEKSVLRDGALFKIGFAQFRLRNFLAARNAWRELLKDFPDSEYADKASFWLAETEFRLGSYEESLRLFEEIHRKNPSGERGFDALYGAAWSSYKLRDFRQALWGFKKALSEYPGSERRDDIQYRTANCYYNLRDREKAVQAYELLVKEYPGSQFVDDALFYIGWSYYRDEKFGEAATAFLRLGEKEAGGALRHEASFWAADSYSRMGDYETAASLFKKLSDGTSVPDSLRGAGRVRFADALFNLGKVSQAEPVYREAVSNEKHSELVESAYYGLIRSLEALGQRNEAKRVSVELSERFPASSMGAQILLKSGEADMRMGNYEEALQSFEKVLKTTSSQDVYFYTLLLKGRANLFLKRYERALESYEKASASEDRHTRALAHLGTGLTCFKTGDLSRAVSEFEKSVAFAPNSEAGIDARFNMGKAYFELGDSARAENIWQEFLLNWGRERELAGEAHLGLGLIYKGRKEFERAAEHFGSAVQKLSSERGAEAQYWKAQCQLDLKDYRRAVVEFRKVSDLFPNFPLWDVAARFKIGECYEGLGLWKEARDEYALILLDAKDEISLMDARERIRWIEEKYKW